MPATAEAALDAEVARILATPPTPAPPADPDAEVCHCGDELPADPTEADLRAHARCWRI